MSYDPQDDRDYDCETCGGSGKVECPRCEGVGECTPLTEEEIEDGEPECDGGQIQCPSCGGAGVFTVCETAGERSKRYRLMAKIYDED
jgi:hypothetical protein